jgi:hypothetical protein
LNVLQEVVVQVLSQPSKAPIRARLSKINWKRVVSLGLYGYLVSGPANHYLYSALFVVVRKLSVQTNPFVASIFQLLAANFILSPALTACYVLALLTIQNDGILPSYTEWRVYFRKFAVLGMQLNPAIQLSAKVRDRLPRVLLSPDLNCPVFFSVRKAFVPEELWVCESDDAFAGCRWHLTRLFFDVALDSFFQRCWFHLWVSAADRMHSDFAPHS